MQIFTLYHMEKPVDQQYIFGDEVFSCPQGWTDTTADPSIIVETMPIPVPASVTNYQCRATLMGIPSPSGTVNRTLFDDINDELKTRGGLAWQAWEYSSIVERNGPLVLSLITMLNMTDAQADQLFITASQVSA